MKYHSSSNDQLNQTTNNLDYETNQIRNTYGNIDEHFYINRLIVHYSKIKKDIRRAALKGLDLRTYKRVLDIGSGFGFFSNLLAGYLHPKAHITGIDILEENKEPYLMSTRKKGLDADFICDHAEIIKQFQNNTYDLIISCYSLYFFPELIPEIARILQPNGLFIIITHSKENQREIIDLLPACYRDLGIEISHPLAIEHLLEAFCQENAKEKLSPQFNRIEETIWDNYLMFPYNKIYALYEYIYYKKDLLCKEIQRIDPELEDPLIDRLFKLIRFQSKRNGSFYINKKDAIYRCSLPVR